MSLFWKIYQVGKSGGASRLDELKRTPLHPAYKKYGAKTIDFGGWALPVQFSSIKEEHEAVRTRAGLFDVSHMGEVEVSGPEALSFIQKMTTNDASKLSVNQAQYTLLCYPDGGTVDDLLVYKLSENRYLLVINAANIEKDYAWLQEHVQSEQVSLINVSAQTAQLAIQGPKAESILQRITDIDLSQIKYFRFLPDVKLGKHQALVSRTGYTGEDGFEIYCQQEDAIALWEQILAAGQPEGIIPCGLGARDTLRFEARLPLYGQELSQHISPIEAGLGFAVKVDKKTPFIGQQVLAEQKQTGASRKLVGIEMIDRGIARTHYPVFVGEQKIGEVTTGTQSPTLKKNIALALIEREYSDLDSVLEVEIRGKRLKAKVVATPFYKRQS
jgi:aminomethyltransferase